MSIAEKLTIIAENQQRVYEAGKLAGGGTPMWLPYITSCQAMFKDATFPENTEITLELPPITDAYGFAATFQNTKNATNIKLIVPAPADSDSAISCQSLLQGNYDVKCLDITEFNAVVHNWVNAFYMAQNLEEIIGEIRSVKKYSGQNFGNAFYGCTKLREVRFAKDAIWEGLTFELRNLSDASLQSAVDALKDMTGETTQIFKLHATVGAKLTDAQKATITAKNWTLVY